MTSATTDHLHQSHQSTPTAHSLGQHPTLETAEMSCEGRETQAQYAQVKREKQKREGITRANELSSREGRRHNGRSRGRVILPIKRHGQPFLGPPCLPPQLRACLTPLFLRLVCGRGRAGGRLLLIPLLVPRPPLRHKYPLPQQRPFHPPT